MNIDAQSLRFDERVIFALRSLFTRFGYSYYKMSKFEEYDFYARNKSFLVSGNIITSRAMGTAIPFGLAIVEHYLGRDTARALGENILYYNG